MSDQYPNNDEIRKWAQSKRAGATLSDRGKLPRVVILAWNKAHPDRPYVAAQAWHGTDHGYNVYDCRCSRCADAHSEQGRNYYAAGGSARWDA